MNIINTLKEVMQKYSVSKADIGRETGIHDATLWRYFNKGENWTRDNLLKVVECLYRKTKDKRLERIKIALKHESI